MKMTFQPKKRQRAKDMASEERARLTAETQLQES